MKLILPVIAARIRQKCEIMSPWLRGVTAVCVVVHMPPGAVAIRLAFGDFQVNSPRHVSGIIEYRERPIVPQNIWDETEDVA